MWSRVRLPMTPCDSKLTAVSASLLRKAAARQRFGRHIWRKRGVLDVSQRMGCISLRAAVCGRRAAAALQAGQQQQFLLCERDGAVGQYNGDRGKFSSASEAVQAETATTDCIGLERSVSAGKRPFRVLGAEKLGRMVA